MVPQRQSRFNIASSTRSNRKSNLHDEHVYQFTAVDINDTSEPFVAASEDPPNTQPKAPDAWSIGWLTPTLIVGCFFAAAGVAIANYVYFNKIGGGRGRVIEDTGVSQEWNNAVTQIFARAFSISLAASASPAFAQLLWWYLRRKALPLDQIEALFQINFGPLNLYQVGLLKVVPVLWFFGLVFPLIPIATIFPPGSLVVEQLPWPGDSMVSIPTLDIDYRGNGSITDFYKYAMFDTMPDGEYKMPYLEYSAIGKRSLLEGSYLIASSPCGVNCSYDVVFAAPSLRCQDVDASAVAQRHFNISFDDQSVYYRASSFHQYDHQYQLIIIWSESKDPQQAGVPRALICIAMAATYNAHINYTNSVQLITVDVTDEVPLNATALYASSLFYDVRGAINSSDDIQYPTPYKNFSVDELNEMFRGCQLLSMVESFAEPLNGEAVALGTDGYNRSTSLIQEMSVVTNKSSTYEDYNLSPDVLRDLMMNVSLSIFNHAQNFTPLIVTTKTYKASYVFKSPLRLIAAYATALAVTAIFLLFGFCAMLQNGVSATPGGFMQLLCTTTHGDGTLNRMAREACLGGNESMSAELKKLRVRYGEISGGDSRLSFVAFGTEDETSPLVKGRVYDGSKAS